MTLPSPTGSRALNGVGFFEVGAPAFGGWLAGALGERWSLREAGFADESEVVRALAPSRIPGTHVCVPLSEAWTVVVNDAALGTDLGVIPTHATRRFGCRSIRAVTREAGQDRPPARILEVYGPGGSQPRLLERSLAVLQDGTRWVFETSGVPFDFEETLAYESRSPADRLTSAMVLRYLRALGVPIDVPPDWARAIRVTRSYAPS